MKIELYLVPNDKEGELLKKFLERNKLNFKEITQNNFKNKRSSLKIKHSHSIQVIEGFNPIVLKQLLEHIKKYKPKIQ